MFAMANFTFMAVAEKNLQANLETNFVIRKSICHIELRQGESDLTALGGHLTSSITG